jgi:hypothetical protein
MLSYPCVQKCKPQTVLGRFSEVTLENRELLFGAANCPLGILLGNPIFCSQVLLAW